jgi:hypothetical protein
MEGQMDHQKSSRVSEEDSTLEGLGLSKQRIQILLNCSGNFFFDLLSK